MNKTVLITGSSTGIGRATAKYFADKNWNVSATMRTPSNEKEFNTLKNVICPSLDVTNNESIKSAINETIDKFGKIDVLVNNAGYGLHGPFEATKIEQVKNQFNTNVFGLMDVIKEILPHFRKNKNGVIANISSMGGRITFPLYSVYHSSKWAVEGFSESLQYELMPFNIRVKIIEPGAIKTDFISRSADIAKPENTNDYDDYINKVNKKYEKTYLNATSSEYVAKVIYKAVNDNSSRLRYTAGSDAGILTKSRKFLPDEVFMKMVKTYIENT